MAYLSPKPKPLYSSGAGIERICLKCDKPFLSLQGLRICDPCTELNRGVAKRVDRGGSRHHGKKRTGE